MLRVAARLRALASTARLPERTHRQLCSATANATLTGAPQISPEGAELALLHRPEYRPVGDTSRKYVKVDEAGVAYAVGRRKKARALVWLWETPSDGEAEVTINGKTISGFCDGHWAQRYTIMSPFAKTDTAGTYCVRAMVKGGGFNGQAEALRLGIATAMQGLDFSLRPILKSAGFLKVDSRRRERKKPGQAGARKRHAWVKR